MLGGIPNPIESRFDKITKYHYYVFALIFLAKVPVTWHLLSVIIVSTPISWSCDGVKEKCPCENPKWDHSVFEETSIMKFQMICERSWAVSLTASIFYFGLLVGSFSFGYISDKFGRLTSYSLSCLVVMIAALANGFMPVFALFAATRFIQGIGVGGTIVTSYVLVVEFCGTSYRERISALFHVPINIGHASLAGVSYLIRHETYLHIATAIPLLYCAALYFLMDESPKWLLDNNKIDRAASIMTKICKFNNKPHDTIHSEMVAYRSQSSQQVEKISFWNIFKYRRLTLNFFCMAFQYLVCGMGYYGVSQFIGKMSTEVHKNVAISGTLTIPGSLLSALFLTILGRKSFLISCEFLSGITLMSVILVPKGLSQIVIASIANMFFFMCFIIVFLYGVELFPTPVRNSVLGILSVVSRTGAMISPIINGFSQTVAGSLFASLAIIGSFLVYFLPETKNTQLPSTLEEGENMGRRRPQPV